MAKADKVTGWGVALTSYKTANIPVAEDDPLDVEAIRRAFARPRIANPIDYGRDGIDALRLLRG